MIADRPAAVPSGANLDSVIGSRTAMFETATRPASFSGVSKAPSGVDSFGNCTTMICSGMILLPIGMGTLATATLFRFLVKPCALDRYLLTDTAASTPKISAPTKTKKKRLFRMGINSPFSPGQDLVIAAVKRERSQLR